MSPRARKTSAAFLLSLTLFLGSAGLFVPRTARAQMVVTDPVTGANTTINNVEDFLDKVLLGGVTMAFINAINYFAQKIAYDAAVYIASGGKGQGTLFQYKDFGAYLSDVALGAAGEAIGTFSEIGFLGFNLCEPSGPDAPRINLAVQLGIASQYQSPEPKCEWSDIAQSWDQFTTSFETGAILRNIQVSVGPGQTGLSALFQAPLKVKEKVSAQELISKLEREEGDGFKAVTDIVTGRQKTPAAVIRETALEQTARQSGQQQQSTASVIGPVLSKGVIQVLTVALGTFVNTLASTLLQSAFEGGLFETTGYDLACAFRDAVPDSREALSGLNCPPDLSDAESVVRGGRAAARAAFAGLLAPRVSEVASYDAVAEFTVCPDTLRGPNNCVMDPSFAAGVRVALQGEPLTVRQAIQQGYLHADWPLVPPTGEGASRNADPYCFTNAYCYSNLIKLRKARIIPIGFELAAEKADPDTTLGDVVSAFNDCDGPNGEFCKLIDPDWIIKYPVTQCRARVYGPTLLTADSDIRSEVCVDAPTCIAENPDGTCGTGYGYCTRERNVWRIEGDSCPAQYAGCQTYAGQGGRSLSVLTTTVDRGICSVENAGCRWYATAQDPAGDTGDWRADQGRLFLDRDAGTCDAQAAGCTELIRREGLEANLVRNPSFESREQTATRPDAWVGAPAAYVTDLFDAQDGSAAVVPGAGPFLQVIGIDPGETYAFSYHARWASGAAVGGAFAQLRVTDAAGTALSVPASDTSCAGMALAATPDSDVVFSRAACSFTAPAAAAFVEVSLTSSSGAQVDAVQLEYGRFESGFRATAYATTSRDYLTLPPAWLGCTGGDTDPPGCEDYAGICRQDEVGCDAYTPSTGGTPVPGIVADENRCPAVCAGYATYKEEASTLSFARYPVHLIPQRGDTCSVASAGCTEFTNLDLAAAGGEAREYYAQLRTCEKPAVGETVPVYYTWEGSDTTGFQLKEWRLKAGAAVGPGGARPPEVIRGTDLASCTREIYLAGTNPDCREFFDIAGNVSYRLYSRTIVITEECRPLRMTELPTDPAATDAASCSAGGGRFVDGRCNVCEGIGGTWNSTSVSDLGCTFNAYAPESRSCGAPEAGCRLYTGNAGANVRRLASWDFEGGSRDGWQPDAATAVSTESTAVGGHSLRVDAGTELTRGVVADPRIVQGDTYYLTFWAKGRGTVGVRFSGARPEQAFTAGATLGATWNRYSFGPVLVDWVPAADERLVFTGFTDTSFIDRVELTRVASNIALVKDSWTIPAVCDQNAAGAFLPQAQLGCTEYRAEKAERTEYLTGFSSLCREKAVGCTAFVQTQQSLSPGRESWNALCVLAAPAAAPTPCTVDGREVCTVGVNRRSCRYVADDVPLAVSFAMAAAGTCQVDGVTIVDGTGVPVRLGAPGTCVGRPQDLVVVPADRTVYVVDDGEHECDQGEAGCTLAGNPAGRTCTMPDGADADSAPDACTPGAGATTCDCTVGGELICRVAAGETACRAPLPWREPYPAGTAVAYADVPVLNNPQTYGESLCTIEAVGCQEWTEVGITTGKAYFKDPEDRTCEYRKTVRVGTREYDGWFRKGTDIPCDGSYVISGATYGIWRNGDVDYAGFAGLCPAQFSSCTEFLDPTDKDITAPLGRPYTYLKNQKIDLATCRDQVNPLDGCVLFNDTSSPVLSSSADVSNLAAEVRGGASAPVTCGPAGCGQCLYRSTISGTTCTSARWGGSCSVTEHCLDAEAGETGTCVLPAADGSPSEPRFAGGGTCSDRFLDGRGREVSLGDFQALYAPAQDDANVVMKVTRDRVCGEWLACQSSTPVWDPSRNRFIEICDAIGRCAEYQKSGDTSVCTRWVSREPTILTAETYASRETGYGALDYSGYSVPHMYDVESLRQIPVGRFCTDDATRACESDADCAGVGLCNQVPTFRLARVIGACDATAVDGDACDNADFPARGTGRCWSGFCAQSPYGSPVETATVLRDEPLPLTPFGIEQNTEAPSCRTYPERNAPFPNSVVREWKATSTPDFLRSLPKTVSPSFNRATLCERGQDCECTYEKIEYTGGQGTIYRSAVSEVTPPSGLCQGGPRDKQDCDPSAATSCGTGGTCNAISRVNTVQGIEGYCLERDLGFSINGLQDHSYEQPGRACITWLPVDRLSGNVDVYNNYPNAGFNVSGAAYCAVPDAYKRIAPYARFNTTSHSIMVGGDPYTVVMGCAENTLSDVIPECTPYCRAGSGGCVEPKILIDDEQGNPERDCPADEAFVVMAGVPSSSHDAAGVEDCPGRRTTYESGNHYICVPRNSRHMADPLKRPCEPPREQGLPMQRYNQATTSHCDEDGIGYVTPAQIPTYIQAPASYAEVWLLEGKTLKQSAGLDYPDDDVTITATGIEPDSALGHYADCVALDTPIPDGPNSPGTPFLGCEAAVTVATVGSPVLNKVYTGRLGNGRTTPPGAGYTITDPIGIRTETPELRYTWAQTPDALQPYGRAVTANIDEQTAANVDYSPVEHLTCRVDGTRAYNLPTVGGTCPAGATEVSNAESRPYATITAGGTGITCPVGEDGDVACSAAPGASQPQCDQGSGRVRACLQRCTVPSGGTDPCPGLGLGTCEFNVDLNAGFCTTPVDPGPVGVDTWATSPRACDSRWPIDGVRRRSDPHDREIVGTCVNADSSIGSRACVFESDCAHLRCVPTDPERPTAGICQNSGTGTGRVCDVDGVTCRSYGADAAGTGLPNLEYVLERLRQLFAATQSLFLYHRTDVNSNVNADYRVFAPGVPLPAEVDYDPASLVYDESHIVGQPPVVLAVEGCNTSNQCFEGATDRITVNGQSVGDIVGGNGFKQVSVRFFAYAQNDQMPIRNVIVDWGDGTNPSGNNPNSSYKNRRGYEYRVTTRPDGTEARELQSRCDGTTFGTSSDACDSTAPFAYNHAYICSSDPTARCWDGTNNCVRVQPDGREACVYRPRVQVQDNWGFCNGTCDAPGGTAASSCYNALTNSTLTSGGVTTNECALTPGNIRVNTPFTEYAGDIIVYPHE